MPENLTYEPKSNWRIFATNVLLGAAGFITVSAFTHKVRKEIFERDGQKCIVCGATDHLEAAHLNHDRSHKDYNEAFNGKTLCTKHHLEDHLNRAGHNGLSRGHNDWAINKLRERLFNQEP